MREILFRGKTTGGEWFYGSLVHRTLFYGDPCDDYVILSDGEFDFDYYEDHEVITETVGQFTELTDKNGKKVFEGDILKFTDINADYEWIGRVEFGNPNEEYNWGFQLVYIKGEKPNTDILLWFDMEDTGAFAEVIGNIHDNPELLEE